MTTTLFALELGASEFTTGVLMSLFALLPAVLSVSAGRLIDRAGPRRPLLLSFGALAFAAALPFAFPFLEILYLSTTLLGVAFMYVHIAMNSVFGAAGSLEQRALNFSWLALGFSISNSIGPLVAGYAIDGLGHARGVRWCWPCFRSSPLVLLWLRKRPLPRPEHVPLAKNARVLDLLRIPGLQQTFWVSLLLATGWDLYTFLIPLYGARIGLSAASIGVILSTFAVATLTVRLVMPLLIRKVRQWAVIFAALSISGRLLPAVSLGAERAAAAGAVVRPRPRPGQRAAGHHVAALRGVAARAPGRSGGPAHLAPQRQPYDDPARFGRGVHRGGDGAGVLGARRLPARRRVVRAQTDQSLK